MLLSDIIKELQRLKDLHGDINTGVEVLDIDEIGDDVLYYDSSTSYVWSRDRPREMRGHVIGPLNYEEKLDLKTFLEGIGEPFSVKPDPIIESKGFPSIAFASGKWCLWSFEDYSITLEDFKNLYGSNK